MQNYIQLCLEFHSENQVLVFTSMSLCSLVMFKVTTIEIRGYEPGVHGPRWKKPLSELHARCNIDNDVVAAWKLNRQHPLLPALYDDRLI
jgi:hypothetical protein